MRILEMLVKKAKPVDLGKLEMKLRDELLRDDTDLFIRGYVGPNWPYMKRVFTECSGKR